MSNALLSDVEARAQRRRTRTRAEHLDALATDAWRAAQAAADPAENRALLERARRLAPRDALVAASLAAALLRDGELGRAAALFREGVARHGAVEAWCGAIVCAHLAGDAAEARAALRAALRAHAPGAGLLAAAGAVGPAEGWCGLWPSGRLHASVRPVAVRLDGAALKLRWAGNEARLPPGWRAGGTLEVEGEAGPLLGSPLGVAAFAGVEGFVEAAGGGLLGWAWHKADPSAAPVLRVEGALGALTVRAAAVDEATRLANPFARARRFAVGARAAAALGEVLAVTGPDGRALLGSPLDPGLEARGGMAPRWVDAAAGGAGGTAAVGRAAAVDVVVPVYRGVDETLACLASVRAGLRRGSRLIVVDDASPEPGMRAALDGLARRRWIVLVRLERNRGFPGAANAGMALAAGRDVVLLNSDTLVPPGWLERLRAAAYAAPDIGTATPLTNDGSIVSVPDPEGGNPMPDAAGTARWDGWARRANGGAVVDIPVGVGFCLYVRRDCLDQVGPLREDVFAQGYGEENDLCLRARQAGWRHVAAAGVFVAHAGARSFGAGRGHLMRRNAAMLERLHPGYDAMVAAHVAADPLLGARRRLDALRWAEGRRGAAVAMVTHAGGGGVERVVRERAAAAARAGLRAIVLRPGVLRPGVLRPGKLGGGAAVRVEDPAASAGEAAPNLLFGMPGEFGALVRLLRGDRVGRVEVHHMLGHHAGLGELAGALGAEQVSVVHDYARFCPRIALVTTTRRYCGEPDVAGCEACVADLGSLLEDDPPVRELLARSAAELGRSARVVAPSMDAARRIGRHFPGVAAVAEPWEGAVGAPPAGRPGGPETRVVVVGAIGVEKGFDVLLGCARDARARGLALRFVVVGFTADDARLMEAGPVLVTGEYAEAEAVGLIRAQAGHLALIPSVWPETWCFALTRAWEAGLRAAVFDLGAQAERVRASGRGWVLPLGLEGAALNDALLRLASAPAPCDATRR